MTPRHHRNSWLSLLAAVALSACSPTSAPPSPSGNLRAVSGHDMVAQVRAAGSGNDVLDVHPLQDPQVEDLRMLAARLEASADVAGASDAIAHALALRPDDPELLQNAAELDLYRKDWVQAEHAALKSYQLGPKLGSLCRRNWTALRFARSAQGDASGVAEAETKFAKCTLEPPVRM